ncbi:Rtp1 protein [Saccharomycopsis crataegensis]|uniref:Rtp1 protein n=1 Tax=Saccharomycopsis crataegensis TaxID=43959 RepID=A0AAV5QMF0_9ASCO|nr:Rtp1 protein [Saccharomycopsis crataegensis]
MQSSCRHLRTFERQNELKKKKSIPWLKSWRNRAIYGGKTMAEESEKHIPKKLKGLVAPRFSSKKPLDLLFIQLTEIFKIEDNNQNDTINILYERISKIDKDIDDETNFIPFSLKDVVVKFQNQCERDEEFQKRVSVIKFLLHKLIQIKKLTMKDKPKFKNKYGETLMISLHDMKTFGHLLNLIIVEGIYSALPNNIGISLEKRRLNEFKKDKKGFKAVKIFRIKNDRERFELLMLIMNKFLVVFEDSDGANDVKELLLKGMGFSDLLICALYVIYNPDITGKPSNWENLYDRIESISPTFELFELYSLLVNPTNVAPWFKAVCLEKMTYLPLRRKTSGVISLIEFLTGMRYNEDVNVEKVGHVNRILLNKPSKVSTVEYFNNISSQMYNILILVNRPILASVCVNFIESLFKRNPRIVQDFYFVKIWYRCNVALRPNFNKQVYKDGDIMIKGRDFDNLLNVIFSITKNNSDNQVLDSLFSKNDLTICLWNYLIFLQQKSLTNNKELILEIFKLYFTLVTSDSKVRLLSSILDNLLIGLNNFPWIFDLEFNDHDNDSNEVVTQSVCVKYQSFDTKEFKSGQTTKERIFDSINMATDLYLIILEQVDDSVIQELFILILKRWLLKDGDGISQKLFIGEEEEEAVGYFKMLINLRLLQSMSLKFKDQINNNKNMTEILEIVDAVLANYKSNDNAKVMDANNEEEVDSDDEVDEINEKTKNLSVEDDSGNNDDTVLTITLELLSSILSENSSYQLIETAIIEKLDSIMDKLNLIGQNNESLSASIASLKQAIQDLKDINNKFEQNINDDELSQKETIIKLNKIQQKYENDLKGYEKAMKYLNDKIVPVRVHGLQLINELIFKKSKIVTLQQGIKIYLEQLQNTDPFIYLSSIKGLATLLQFDLETALPVLLEIYGTQRDGNDEYDTDTILKIGEVINALLLKYESNPLYSDYSNRHSSLLFPSKLTKLVCHTTINLVKVPPKETPKISNGIRVSALSLLESCFRINLNGVNEYLQDTLDLVIGILTFELKDTEDEVSMRRGAIKLLHSVVYSEIDLKEFPKGYGKKIIILLAYAQEKDDDLLIREQAGDTLSAIKEIFKQSIFGDTE